MRRSTSVSSVGSDVCCSMINVLCLYFKCFKSKGWALIATWVHAQYFTVRVFKLCTLLVLSFPVFCDIYRIHKVCLIKMWECLIWWLVWFDDTSEFGAARKNTIHAFSFRCVRNPCPCLFLLCFCLLVGRAGTVAVGFRRLVYISFVACTDCDLFICLFIGNCLVWWPLPGTLRQVVQENAISCCLMLIILFLLAMLFNVETVVFRSLGAWKRGSA